MLCDCFIQITVNLLNSHSLKAIQMWSECCRCFFSIISCSRRRKLINVWWSQFKGSSHAGVIFVQVSVDLCYHEGWWHSPQTDVPQKDDKMTKYLGRNDFRANALQAWDQFCLQWFHTVECYRLLQIIITYHPGLENSALFILQVLQIVSCRPWLCKDAVMWLLVSQI